MNAALLEGTLVAATPWSIRKAHPHDCARIADLHLETFAGFFISELGRHFAARLYRAFICEADGICLVVETTSDRQIIGFVAGTLAPVEFFKRLRRREALGFALDALPTVLRHPLKFGRRLARGLIYRGDRPAGIAGAALLSSIAVSREMRGTGVAEELVHAFCAEINLRGSKSVYLMTDRDDNARANAFYARLQFQVQDQVRRGAGRTMNRYVRTF